MSGFGRSRLCYSLSGVIATSDKTLRWLKNYHSPNTCHTGEMPKI